MRAKKNNGRVLVKLAIVLVVLAGLGVTAYFSLRSTARVVAVKRGLAEDAVTGSVTIDAEGGIKQLKSEASGKVIDVEKIKPNTRFKKDDPLVQLDTTDLVRERDEFVRRYDASREKAEIEQKRNTELKVAEANLATAKRLHSMGDATEEQVRQAERALAEIQTRIDLREFAEKQAEADFKSDLNERNLRIAKMTIRAPSDGQIHEALTWNGALIGEGQPVAEFISNERVIAVRISEENFGRIKVGQRAKLRLLTYGDEMFDATVSELFPVADDAQRFKVFLKVEVDPDRLKPKSTGEATISIDKRDNQPIIPRRALFNGNQVFVVKDGVVEQRQVEVGFKALNEVEILKGLEEGELVIVETLEQFRPGKRVRVELVKD